MKKRLKENAEKATLMSKTVSDIFELPHKAWKLLERYHAYNEFLLRFLTLTVTSDVDKIKSNPSLLVELLMEPLERVEEFLTDIYVDLISLKSDPIEFNNLDIIFCVNNERIPEFQFIAKPVPVIPKVGDNIHLPFYRAMTDGQFFQVERVTHFFADGVQQIYVELKPGSVEGIWEERHQNQENNSGLFKFDNND